MCGWQVLLSSVVRIGWQKRKRCLAQTPPRRAGQSGGRAHIADAWLRMAVCLSTSEHARGGCCALDVTCCCLVACRGGFLTRTRRYLPPMDILEKQQTTLPPLPLPLPLPSLLIRLPSCSLLSLLFHHHSHPSSYSHTQSLSHSTLSHSHTLTLIHNGTHKANRPKVDRRQGPAQAARSKGSAQVCTRSWRCKEAPPIPPWNSGAPRDPSVPEGAARVSPSFSVFGPMLTGF